MIKQQEIDNLASCLNRAAMDEPLFVLLGRDVTAADTVRAWTQKRIEAGKNQPGDAQIAEALAIADAMQVYAARTAAGAPSETARAPVELNSLGIPKEVWEATLADWRAKGYLPAAPEAPK